MLTITFEDDPQSSDLQVIEEGLVSHAVAAHIEPRNYRHVVIFLRNEEQKVVGGLIGATVWGWLHVKELWLSAELRGMGYGRKLLQAAEHEAARRGCHHAYLDTFDFQTLDFYVHLGYQVFGSLADFPSGHVRYFVMKALVESQVPSP